MKTRKAADSTIEKTLYPENILKADGNISFQLENWFDVFNKDEKDWVLINWSILAFRSSLICVKYEFCTLIEIEETVDHDTDLKEAKLLVMDSCTKFFEDLYKMYRSMPMMEPKFEELALRLLQEMTLEGLYD
jgi:hypothetical protein